MASVDDVQGHASAAETPLEQARTQAAAAAEQGGEAAASIDAARQSAEELAQASQAIGLGPEAARAEAIRGSLEELHGTVTGATSQASAGAGALAEAVDKLSEIQTEIEALRGLVRGGTSPRTAHPPTSGSTPRPSAKGPPLPPLVRELAERLPEREPLAKTRAFAYSHEDGAEVEFVSGRDRTAREGLSADYARRYVVRDHTEGHISAQMRRPGGPEEVTVVINNKPCPGPEGCDATIPAIIPEDARMHVYVKDASGVRHYASYTGTGEGIA